MRNGAAIRRFGGSASGVGVDPLVVACRLSEFLHLFLGDEQPIGERDFLANVLAQVVNGDNLLSHTLIVA